MAKLNILHLSDLHIGNTHYDDADTTAINIIDDLEVHAKSTIDCVVITGDIFDGKLSKTIDKKAWALKFLNELKTSLDLNVEDFVIVPGNHDLVRDEKGADFSEYKSLLTDFYGKDYFNKNFDNEYLFNIKVYEEQKVALVALNSCMVEMCKLDNADVEWLNNANFDEETKKEIVQVIENKKRSEWDDYGQITASQLRAAFNELEKRIKLLTEYNIITCFHHHFYPFPEIYNQYGDRSLIRNFTTVIDKLQNKNVKIVLHGHKHMPIVRPVTTHKYLTDPNSIFYVLSAGSVSKKNVENRSFQHLSVYDPKHDKIADVCRFNYRGEELQTPEVFSIPPKKNYDQNTFVYLVEMLKTEFPDEYDTYNDIYEIDVISQKSKIDDIIKNISQTITKFNEIKSLLKNSSINILLLLYSIHYRINALHKNTGKSNIKKQLKSKLLDLVKNEDYISAVVKLLEYKKSSDFERNHEQLLAKYVEYKKCTSIITITTFFTDLYLTFLENGEIYFNKEKLAHSVNIKLEEGTFHQSIPPTTIKIYSDVDRRLSTIEFKCKNPTVHKIAVLIVKDYEKRISKIEDSFRELGLKIYYLTPRVEKDDKYDLENLNFEAYIPTLLPLLTGENLYKNREVFIRELIQNSLDAILLRDDILKQKGESLSPEEKIIRIEIGNEGNNRKYLKITDSGIGMDLYKIERYFTSIGRSFYKSDEFEELQKSENIEYKPISNFGIGFLSAFMVGGEITVLTKSYESDYALEIHIPNYEGCFFIKKNYEKPIKVGTSICIYEDSRKNLNIDKVIKYVKDIFIDFQLEINIYDKINNKEHIIKPHTSRRGDGIKLFCPIVDNKITDISWLNEVKTNSYIDNYKYGILLNVDSKAISERGNEHNLYLNSGILLSDTNDGKFSFNRTNCSVCYYNLPSSYISLDVAREKILSFEGKTIKKNDIISVFAKQGVEILENIQEYYSSFPVNTMNKIAQFLSNNDAPKYELDRCLKKLYTLSFSSKDILSLEQGKGGIDSIITESSMLNMIEMYYSFVEDVINSIGTYDSILEYIKKLRDNLKKDIINNKIIINFPNYFYFMDDEARYNRHYADIVEWDDIITFESITTGIHKKHRYNGKFLNIERLIRSFTTLTNETLSYSANYVNKNILKIRDDYMQITDEAYKLREKLHDVETRGHIIHRVNSDYYKILFHLVSINLKSQINHKDSINFNLSNIIGIFSLFYFVISQKLTIAEAGDFSLDVSHFRDKLGCFSIVR